MKSSGHIREDRARLAAGQGDTFEIVRLGVREGGDHEEERHEDHKEAEVDSRDRENCVTNHPQHPVILHAKARRSHFEGDLDPPGPDDDQEEDDAGMVDNLKQVLSLDEGSVQRK